jgi:hypothetical protein
VHAAATALDQLMTGRALLGKMKMQVQGQARPKGLFSKDQSENFNRSTAVDLVG